MEEKTTLICKTTSWFLWRAVAMLAMFLVFAGWFFKDWKFGYPKKNVEYFHHESFKEAKKYFKSHLEEEKTPQQWREFVATQKVYPEKAKGTIPSSEDLEKPWPEIIADYDKYKESYDKNLNKVRPPLWSDYSDKQGWGDEAPDNFKKEKTIRHQAYWGLGSLVLGLIVLFVLLRNISRSMKADDEAYYAPNGAKIPYPSIYRIDERKWKTKGLAYLYYKEGGVEKKAKVDGMVYGQFDKNKGEPAEQLYQQVLSKFSGELITREESEGQSEEQAEKLEETALEDARNEKNEGDV